MMHTHVGGGRMKMATRLMQLSRPLHDPLAYAVDQGQDEDSDPGGTGETMGDAAATEAYMPGASCDFSDAGGLAQASASTGKTRGEACRGARGGMACWRGAALPLCEATCRAECVSVNALGEVVRWFVVPRSSGPKKRADGDEGGG